MRARIVRIGNSQGIRIPRPLLERSGLGVEVDIEAEPHQIVIRAARPPRAGWNEAFAVMAESGDDALLDGELPALTPFDEEEWEW
jgi:antitoxin MazE